MTVEFDSLQEVLSDRIEAAGLGPAIDDEARRGLAGYWKLLTKWNARTNLTGFDLQTPTIHAVDRLLVEPMFAAQFMSDGAFVWIDIGSGGGSPAIPLKLGLPKGRLTMVEVRSKKAAFLREALRELRLADTSVAEERFEVFADRNPGHADYVTSRAVRLSDHLWGAVEAVLKPGGSLIQFAGAEGTPVPAGAKLQSRYSLPAPLSGSLVVLGRA